eukprot:6988880-Alexandrium_andersonii.AAC.1
MRGLVIGDDAAMVPLTLMQYAHQHLARLIPGFAWGGTPEPPPVLFAWQHAIAGFIGNTAHMLIGNGGGGKGGKG